MTNIAIVGHEAAKFTPAGAEEAKHIIRKLLLPPDSVLVSGGCHLGGVNIWAEEAADELRIEKHIFLPSYHGWPAYKLRNQQIAYDCDVLHCLAVNQLAPEFRGLRHIECYHCGSSDHVKGGGCWTMKEAKKWGRQTRLWIIDNH